LRRMRLISFFSAATTCAVLLAPIGANETV
jgi:hypothetical protein